MRNNPLVRFAADGTPDPEYAEAGYRVLEALDLPVSRHDHDALDEQYPMLDVDQYDFSVSDDAAAYSDETGAATGFSKAA